MTKPKINDRIPCPKCGSKGRVTFLNASSFPKHPVIKNYIYCFTCETAYKLLEVIKNV
jgi:hypothetical protein